jgi:putative FmdB family regulatory protein
MLRLVPAARGYRPGDEVAETMPTYEYVCSKCDQHLEVYQSFSEEPLKRHSGCGGKLTKVMGAVGIVLKGSGFYRTDNRSSSKAGRSESKSESSSGESKSSASESKSDSGTKSDKKAKPEKKSA